MNAIFHRTSVRQFQNKPVEEEKMEQILRAAMAAPSAGNQQPWEFYVITNPKTIQKLSQCSVYAGCAANAPVVLVPCLRTEGLIFPQMGEIDMAIATENILLEITELGLGGVWLGIAPLTDRIEKVDSILDLKDKLHAFALIPIGYPVQQHSQQDRFDIDRIHFIR